MDPKLERLSKALVPVRGTPEAGGPPAPPRTYSWEEPEPPPAVTLRDYWRVLHVRRWTVAAAALFALALAGIYNFVRVPTYRAEATLRIDREEPSIARLDEEAARLPERPDYLETQYKILKSRTLARRVIARLGLDSRPEFTSEIDSGGELEAIIPKGRIHPAVIGAFLERLGVHPSKGTRLVDVTFESIDRELASRAANTLAEEYIDHNLETKWNATQKASGWLRKQLDSLKATLEASENELLDYASKHSILFVEERKDITTEKLAQLEDELTRAETARIEKQSEALLAEDALRREAGLPGSLTSKTYEDLRGKLTELRQRRSELSVLFDTGYPKVQQVERQITEIQSALEHEKQRILGGILESYQLARKREELLESEVLEQRKLVNKISDDFIQYDILKRDAQTNRQLYEGLLQRLKEAGVSAGLRASNIAVLDPAEIPRKPYRPKTWLNFALALMAGLGAGVVLAFAQEHFNTAVRTPDEVERITGLALLALVPRSRERRASKVVTRTLPAPGEREEAGGAPGSPRDVFGWHAAPNGCAMPERNGCAGEAPASPGGEQWHPEPGLSEAFRTLRSSILLAGDEFARRILVTSPQPQEGKTTVSLNLACSLAQLGRRVLIIDGDLRRPNCARQLRVEAAHGLGEYLQGLAALEDAVHPTPVSNLWLVPAGRTNRVASDLLYSPRLSVLLEELGGRYDHVVVDSPPSLVLSDARTIARQVDGLVLVVSGDTERNALLRTKRTFDDAGARFLGFVMNRANLDRLDYGYYRTYGYYEDSSRPEAGEA